MGDFKYKLNEQDLFWIVLTSYNYLFVIQCKARIQSKLDLASGTGKWKID